MYDDERTALTQVEPETTFTPEFWAAVDRRAATMDARGSRITLDDIRAFIDEGRS